MRIIERHLVNLLALTLISVLMLVSCTDDSDSISDERQTLQIVPFGQSYTEAGGTRAVPDGYKSFSLCFPGSQKAIAIYRADENNHCELAGSFVLSGETWSSDIEAKVKTQYYLYGYYPSDCTNNPVITSTDYAQGATLSLPGLNTFSTNDICVTVGVESSGNYGYMMQSARKNKIDCLLLDHIYSSIVVEFKLEEAYANLRQIKLKEVKLQLASAYDKMTANISFIPNASKTIAWVGEGSPQDLESSNLVSQQGGMDLTTSEFQALQEIFIPGSETLSFNLVSTYDVYDKKGNLVRKDCSAINKITLKNSLASPGKRNRIQLTVKPTYLYQLSDPDLDNPTIISNL